jgi:hypothetical protein
MPAHTFFLGLEMKTPRPSLSETNIKEWIVLAFPSLSLSRWTMVELFGFVLAIRLYVGCRQRVALRTCNRYQTVVARDLVADPWAVSIKSGFRSRAHY